MHHDLLLRVGDSHLLRDAGKLCFQLRSHFGLFGQQRGCLRQERLRQVMLVGTLRLFAFIGSIHHRSLGLLSNRFALTVVALTVVAFLRSQLSKSLTPGRRPVFRVQQFELTQHLLCSVFVNFLQTEYLMVLGLKPGI